MMKIMTSDKNEKTTYKIPIGPIHPALKEPIELDLELDGEEVVDVDVKVTQVHRSIEWLGMNRNNIIQTIYLAERICGICNICHPLCLVMAVEQAAGITVPERADYIRTIAAEMERIHSHLLWAGVAAHEIGFDTVFNITWRAREEIMDMIEFVFGNRVTKAIVQVGGVRRDITGEHLPRLQQGLDYYKGVFEHLRRAFLEDETVKLRCRNVGVLGQLDALRLLAVGPVARASGVSKDVRQDQAYAAYPDIGVKAVLPADITGKTVGDVYDRIVVRLYEVAQSVDIIEKCIARMPEGPLLAETRMPRLLRQLTDAEGEGLGRVEAPRGEDIHYVRLEKGMVPMATWHLRAPTYVNFVAVPTILKGLQIADVPIAFASLDPCMSCTNRLTLTDRGSGRKSVITYDEMHRLSLEKTRKLRG